MLQIDVTPYASDALEDAMKLAQTKSLNSYSFSDCMQHLNNSWSDIYSRLAMIDAGYYSTCVRITQKLTHLPPFVKNCISVFAARQLTDYNRQVYRPAHNTDLCSSGSYYISGNDLYVPDADRKVVWLEYVPQPQQIFFTHHNRDPKIIPFAYTKVENVAMLKPEYQPSYEQLYNLYKLHGYVIVDNEEVEVTDWTRDKLKTIERWKLVHRANASNVEDITEYVKKECDLDDGEWRVTYISCNYPYIFISYEHSITGEHYSGFLTKDMEWNEYNPFAFTGLNSNVEYIKTLWNDKTGLGSTVQDYNDIINENDDENGQGMPRVKEIGWTPDTKLIYPDPVVYRYLVARLADKLSALNESNVMGVQKELLEAEYAFEAFVNRNKAGFTRIQNVNPVTVGDLL
jgi:hypothetical protein